MSKITAYTALTTPAASDVVPVVDVSDTTMAASGTTKQITLTNLLSLAVQLDSAAADITANGNQSAGSSTLAARADHIHPSLATPAPADTGVLTWTGDPAIMNGTTASLQTGKLYLTAFWVRKTITISNMAYSVSVAGVTLTSGQNLAGIYNSSGTLMGSTADQSANWTATGTQDTALTSSFSATPGMYWAAFMSNGTTPAGFRGNNTAIGLVTVGQAVSVSRVGIYSSGLTALPSPLTPSSITQPSNAIMHCVLMH